MSQPTDAPTGPRWEPLAAIDRRVVGVLVEKAKTTPEAYPLSLNALRTGANQKSNRFPVMDVADEAVEQSLERLRKLGAVALVQGSSRVERFRHYLYDWLGVDKVELAVMAELLLRGAQTEAELRGRAARMEPIADVAALRPILDRLKAKGLIISLTREGRGHVISHALYLPHELEKLRAQYSAWKPGDDTADDSSEDDVPATDSRPAASPRAFERPSTSPVTPQGPGAAPASPTRSSATFDPEALRREVESLRASVTELRGLVDELRSRHEQTESELRTLRDALGA